MSTLGFWTKTLTFTPFFSFEDVRLQHIVHLGDGFISLLHTSLSGMRTLLYAVVEEQVSHAENVVVNNYTHQSRFFPLKLFLALTIPTIRNL